MTDKMDEICINRKFSAQVNGETLAYLWVILLYFNLESRLIPAVLEGQVTLRLFWNWLGQESDSCHIAVKLEFESIFQAV